MVRYYSRTQLESIVGSNEQVLWRGKPNKICFVLESIFNPLLPFALVWLIFDSSFIIAFSSAKGAENMLSFFIPFMLVHLMPVWLYLGGVILTFLRYKNTEYLITDKSIYISGGSISYTEYSLKYSDIKSVGIKRSFIDQRLGLGDVIISSYVIPENSTTSRRRKYSRFGEYDICDIADFRDVQELIRNHINEFEQTEMDTDSQEEEAVLSEYIPEIFKLYKKDSQ